MEAREQPEADAETRGERHRRHAHAEGDPAPVEDAAQDVASEVIGAERMVAEAPRLPGGRPQALGQHLPAWIPRRDPWRGDRRSAHQQQDGQTEDGAEARPAPDARAGRHRRRDRGPGLRADNRAHPRLRTNTMRGSRYV